MNMPSGPPAYAGAPAVAPAGDTLIPLTMNPLGEAAKPASTAANSGVNDRKVTA